MTYSSSDKRAAYLTPCRANLLISLEKVFDYSRGHLTSCFIREKFSQPFQTLTLKSSGQKFSKFQSKTSLSEPIQTVTNSNSDASDVDSSNSDVDYSAVTLYSVVTNSDLYSVVVTLYSAYSDSSSSNHTNSLYSVVVKSLCELCVEFAYSVVVGGAAGPCYVII